ncbi:MAG: phosphoribosylamine--glycine ligase [Elusimicrobia bacterium RIFCSPLOWO2_01_FULL_54_10]|nr:MAG: phosphoribosylamine--glycine ligase [Elusimicrobia bacterium RIFCSPLOWO2_01_FULL_54_10]
MANGNGNGKHSLKFLCISRVGCIGDLCIRLQEEGCKVKYYIDDKDEKEVSDGFVEKVNSWQEWKDWADVIVFDDADFGAIAENLRKEGKAVIGGTVYTDKLEMNREFGANEMQAAGLSHLPSWHFESFDDAAKFVKDNPERYVVKPNGTAQTEKVLSFIGQEDDGLDVLTILEHYKRGWASKIKSFQVQKFATGVEVAVGAFFNGKEFVGQCCINFEHKRLFNGDIGPTTGEMGTSMFWCDGGDLFKETLQKMQSRLAQAGYIGYFDINCIANARGIFPLECTSRFGMPTLSIQMEGILSPMGEFLQELAKGGSPALRVKKGFQVGVVVAVPPFPFEDPKTFKKYCDDSIVLFKKPMKEGLWPADIKLTDGQWRLSGHTGYVMVVTGSGPTMEDARKEAYTRLKNIVIPNMFYRTDIGERWGRDGDLLRTWGYVT